MKKPIIRNFKVIVNPFTRQVTITATIKGKKVTEKYFYDEADEWKGIEMNYVFFDVHVYYDQEFSVSIYDVTNVHQIPNTVTSYWHNVDLRLELEDGVYTKYKTKKKKSLSAIGHN